MRALVALDLGTTSVRALVVREDGQVEARAQRKLRVLFRRSGWVEQDPDDWWEQSLRVLREAIATSGRAPRELAGLGVVTQRASTVAWDSHTRRALVPAIGWQDRRTESRVRELRELGLPLNTLASATKLEWWMQHADPVRGAAKAGRLRLGTPDTWLTERLTGGAAHVTDAGHASCTALFDPAARAFAPALCELFHVPHAALPEIVSTAAVVGETPRELLGAPVAVAARAGDQQAAAFAQGVHEAGSCKLTLGTSAMLDLHAGHAVPELRPGTYPLVLWQIGDADPAFCLEGTVITAGSAVEWLVDLGLARDGPDVSRLALQAGHGGGVRFVPALQGLGTPWLDPDARGLLLGLTRGSGRAELARAVLDGIAQRAVDLLDALQPEPGPLPLDGGLARSDVLVQRIADLCGRDVVRAAETETTALGAALLAGLATGVYASPDRCREIPRPPTRFRARAPSDVVARERETWGRALVLARGDAASR